MKNLNQEHLSTKRTPNILPAFAKLLPPLSDEQISVLETDILQNGCYSPIIVNEDMVVIDGHNRLNICQKHGIPYRMAVFSFEDDLEAKQWALDTQKGRRNLTINELCKIALKLRPEVEARAKANLSIAGGDNRHLAEAPLTPVSKVVDGVNTRKELAQIVGVGEVTMGRAMKIEDEAPQNVKDAVDSGKLTISQGYNITKELQELGLPDEEQEQAAMESVQREIARKHEVKRRKISEEARTAKAFSAAFEHAAVLRPTVDNVQIWVENSGILYDQFDSTAEDARDIGNAFLSIADIILNVLKPRDWRYKENEREEHAVATTENETPDTGVTAEKSE